MIKRFLSFVAPLLFAGGLLSAAPFTAGSVVVYRIGDGSTALGAAATAVFLDEYSPAGTLIQSIALPIAVSGSNKPFTSAGNASSESYLNLALQGKYLVMEGYSAVPGTASIAATTASAVARVLARVDPTGAIDTSTTFTGTGANGNARSAAANDGTGPQMWIAGSSGGVQSVPVFGAANGNSAISSTTNIRVIGVFGGQFYYSTGSGTTGVYALGSGLPTSAASATLVAASPSPYAFFFADLSSSEPGVDTLYIADDSTSPNGGIRKYSKVGGVWSLNNVISLSGARGITATVSGSTVTIYTTSGTTSALTKIIDSAGYNASINGTASTLATAPTNTVFRGVALAPQNSFITPSTLPAGTTGTAYAQTVSLTGGNACAYTVSAGSLPSNLNLDPASGVISGNPNVAGPSTFTVLATCVNIVNSQSYSVTINSGGGSTNPSGSGTASSVLPGNTTSFSGSLVPGSNPASVTLSVSCDLTAVAGSATFAMTVNLNSFSGTYNVPANVAPQTYSLPCVVSDDQLRNGPFNISLKVLSAAPPTGLGSASPANVTAGNSTTLSATVTPGTFAVSTVACNLSSVGGAAAFSLVNTGGNIWSATYAVPAATAAQTFTLVCTATDDHSNSGTFNISLGVFASLTCESGTKTSTAIHAIQGSGATSPLTGQQLQIEGIVVGSFQDANHLKGFYLQEPDASWDADPTTSEGIFVFDNLSGTAVNIGDRVRVRGTVDEFPSSGSVLGNTQSSNLTEIGTLAGIQVCSTGNTFTRTVVTLPVTNAGDLERYEGMAVQINQQLTVTGNFSLGTFDQLDLAPSLQYTPTTAPGNAASWGAATSLITRSVIALDDASTLANANLYPTIFPQGGLSATNTLRSGDLVNYNSQTQTNSPLIGVLDDRFGEYRIQPTAAVTFFSANPRPAIAPILTSVGGRFRAVSANVLNFFTTLGSRGAATQTEFNNQKTKMIESLGGMDGDVYGLSEVQNFASGSTSGGTYTNAALQSIVDGLNCHKAGLDDLCANPPSTPYALIDVLPLGTANGTDAIRTAIVYRTDKLTPVGPPALYNQNDTNRPTQAQTFQPATGAKASLQTFTFVVNHFRSKGSACGSGQDDPFQGNCNGLRLNMAQNVVGWLAGNPTADPLGASRRLLLVGDFNAYFGEDPIQYFIGQSYPNLINKIIGPNAYSYNFGSQAGYLDHAMANVAMNTLVKSVAEWHNNADEPSSLQALGSASKSAAAQVAYYGSNPYAASDHDPIVIGFNPLCGDLNDDGVVDGTDQAIIRAAIGKPITDRRMDFDGDGKITLTDFSKWSSCAAAYQR